MKAKTDIEKALAHISYSRMMLWKRSRNEFHKRYILGKQMIETAPMRAGKRTNDIVAGIVTPTTEGEKKMLEQFPDFIDGVLSYEIKTELPHKNKKYKMVGEIDYMDHSGEFFEEHKDTTYNGLERIVKYARNQCEFYGMLLRLKKGVNYPMKAIIRATIRGEDYKPTGKVEIYEHKWTDKKLDKWERKVREFINDVTYVYDKEH